MRAIDTRLPALPAAVVALSISWAGCGEPPVSDGPWVSEISRLADTTVVRTVSGSTWERRARLVEELRIGSLEIDDGTTSKRSRGATPCISASSWAWLSVSVTSRWVTRPS